LIGKRMQECEIHQQIMPIKNCVQDDSMEKRDLENYKRIKIANTLILIGENLTEALSH
jgi:hypothetical protein